MPSATETHGKRWRVTKPLSTRIRATPISPVGLPTDGYHCYQNSVIQAFCHIPKFVDWLDRHRIRPRRAPKSSKSSKSRLALKSRRTSEYQEGPEAWIRHLRALIRAFWNTRMDEKTRQKQVAQETEKWREYLIQATGADDPDSRSAFLAGEEQQDIKSYLEVLTALFESGGTVSEREATQLRGLFLIGERRVATCTECKLQKSVPGWRSDTPYWALDIRVPRPGSGPLSTCLDQYFNRDLELSEYPCACKATGERDKDGDPIRGITKHKEVYTIVCAPRVLIIELGILYSARGTLKVNQEALQYDKAIDITKYVDQESRDEVGTLRYRLNSVIGYKGGVEIGTLNRVTTSGHYQIWTRGPGGCFKINDSKGEKLETGGEIPQLAAGFKPTMLFYLAEEDSKNPRRQGKAEATQTARERHRRIDQPQSLIIEARTRSGRIR